MRKKIISMTLALALAGGLLFTGCGEKEEEAVSQAPAQNQTQQTKTPEKTAEEEIRDTANAFLDAMESGDIQKLEDEAAKAVLESDEFKAYRFAAAVEEAASNDILEGVKDKDSSESIQNDLREFTGSLLDMLVVSHSVKEVKKDSDTSGKVVASITYATDLNTKNAENFEWDSTEANEKSSKLVADYLEEHKDELDKMEDDGKSEDEQIAKMMTDELSEFLKIFGESLQKALDESEDTAIDAELTVEKQGDKWLVTAIKKASSEEDSSDDKKEDEKEESDDKSSSSDSSEDAYPDISASDFNEECVKVARKALETAENYQAGKISGDDADEVFDDIKEQIDTITKYTEKNGFDKYSTKDLLLLSSAASVFSDIAFIDMGTDSYKEDLKDHINELKGKLD